MFCCYMFEARSIQRWIFSSGKLRDAVGASLRLDRLCNWDGDDVLDEALSATGLSVPNDVAFVRRGGGGAVLIGSNREAIARLRAVFTLKVRTSLPELEFSDALGDGSDEASARADARVKLLAAQGAPQITSSTMGPFHLIAPRTGTAASARDGSTGEFVDRGTIARRSDLKETRSQIEARFDPDSIATFPSDMGEDGRSGGESFPFLGDNRYIGLIHADGNGIGAVWKRLGDAGVGAEHLARFSQALETSTANSAHAAMLGIKSDYDAKAKKTPDYKLDVWPVRPLILGGDDLTAIVRGDHAISFARDFLAAFEEETEKAFAAVRKEIPALKNLIPDRASAGAGIAFIKANQPFQQAYALCQSLAEFAKSTAKTSMRRDAVAAPATLAFHRVSTSSIPPDWGTLAERELEQDHIWLTACPYQVATKSAIDDLPSLDELEYLTEALHSRAIARGPIRGLTPEFFSRGWPIRWQRISDVAKGRDRDAFERVESILKELGCTDGPTARLGDRQVTPLFDALSWIAVARRRREQN